MFYKPMKPIISFYAVLSIAVVGCGDVSPPRQTEPVVTEIEAARAKTPSSESQPAQTYVKCLAMFSSYEKDHPWFDDSSVGHDDGKAPLASFVLVEPANYANRTIGILCKHTADVDTAFWPDAEEIGRQFTFQIPADFLSGDHKIIDNSAVRVFCKVEP